MKHQGRSGRWFVIETANFQIRCERSESPGTHLARHAEKLRRDLQRDWLGKVSPAAWSPKCQIVLHTNRSSYIAEVGRAGARTVGSSLVASDRGLITKRRIDLVGAGTNFLSAALPHELTHVVLKDRFVSSDVPRWADEGMAILADAWAKQSRHERDLQQALSHRTAFHVAELLASDGYPDASRFGAFYGQSASVTKFLVSRKSREKFVRFLERARKTGYDTALRESYGIGSVGELDRQWRHAVISSAIGQ